MSAGVIGPINAVVLHAREHAFRQLARASERAAWPRSDALAYLLPTAGALLPDGEPTLSPDIDPHALSHGVPLSGACTPIIVSPRHCTAGGLPRIRDPIMGRGS